MNNLSVNVIRRALCHMPNAAQHYKSKGKCLHFVQVPTQLQGIRDNQCRIDTLPSPRSEVKLTFMAELAVRSGNGEEWFDWVLVNWEEVTIT